MVDDEDAGRAEPPVDPVPPPVQPPPPPTAGTHAAAVGRRRGLRTATVCTTVGFATRVAAGGAHVHDDHARADPDRARRGRNRRVDVPALDRLQPLGRQPVGVADPGGGRRPPRVPVGSPSVGRREHPRPADPRGRAGRDRGSDPPEGARVHREHRDVGGDCAVHVPTQRAGRRFLVDGSRRIHSLARRLHGDRPVRVRRSARPSCSSVRSCSRARRNPRLRRPPDRRQRPFTVRCAP